jgi:hypothetical protein
MKYSWSSSILRYLTYVTSDLYDLIMQSMGIQGNLMIKTLDNIWKSNIFTPICFVNASHFCNLHLFMYTCVQYNFYIRWYSYHLTVTQWVPVVEQELSTLSEHLNSAPIFPVAQYLVLCGMFCGPLFVFSNYWHLLCYC